jgi:hypothetical protein
MVNGTINFFWDVDDDVDDVVGGLRGGGGPFRVLACAVRHGKRGPPLACASIKRH